MGFAQELRGQALANRGEMGAVSFLASKPVQDMLDNTFARATASSLDVERKHAEARRWETSKLTHVATAARNCFLQRYLRERLQASKLFEQAQRNVRRASHVATTSLEWETQPQARPFGRRLGGASRDPGTAGVACGTTRISDGCDVAAEIRERKQAAAHVLQSL